MKKKRAQPAGAGDTSANPPPPDDLSGQKSLRRQAEAIALKRENTAPAAEADALRLVPELQVHQIELELQNEELIRSRVEIETLLRQYTDLYDFAPVGYFTLARDGAIRAVNLAGANLLGVERGALLKRRFGQFVSDESCPAFNGFLENLDSAVGKKTCELALLKNGKARFWADLEAAGFTDEQECHIALMDITERKRAEDNLREAEERLELFFSQPLDGFFFMILDEPVRWDDTVDKEKVLDYVFAHQCVTKINDAMLEQYRAGREQFIGLTPNDFFAHDLEQGRRIWREFFDSGHLDVETDERRFDGTQMWIEGHYVCMHDNEGRITGHFGIQRDITARRQAEEQIRKLSQAVEQSPTSIVITDKDGDIEYVNPKFEQLTGYSFEEARGKNPRILKSGEQSLEYYQDLWKTIKGGKVWRGVFHNRRKDGSLFWESEIIAPILDQAGQIVNYVAVKEDVTARIVAEENLNLAMKQLEQSNNELRTFAYAASHELQEPLRMVSSYVQLLARRYQDKLDSDAAEFIGFALEGADRMKKLIDNLLEYSRIGTHGKGFTKTDCNQVVRQALDNLQIEIKESGAQVAAERLPELLADETQLIALFQNLVGNAVKFRGKQAPQVSIRAEAREADWVFAVQDNGIGLDPRDAERVFDVFQRLHTREEYPGTGIGLSLCKRIVERHGGKIWVKSQSDRGATFYFTLPNGERK